VLQHVNVFLNQYSCASKLEQTFLENKFSICVYDYTTHWESNLHQYSTELKNQLQKISKAHSRTGEKIFTQHLIQEGLINQHRYFFKKIDILWQAFYNPKNLNKQKDKQ
jgi:hypothetical protein